MSYPAGFSMIDRLFGEFVFELYICTPVIREDRDKGFEAWSGTEATHLPEFRICGLVSLLAYVVLAAWGHRSEASDDAGRSSFKLAACSFNPRP